MYFESETIKSETSNQSNLSAWSKLSSSQLEATVFIFRAIALEKTDRIMWNAMEKVKLFARKMRKWSEC